MAKRKVGFKVKKELTHKQLIIKDVSKHSAIEAVLNSEGGKIILDSLKKDILGAINEICFKYKEGGSAELLAVCAKLSERIALFSTISQSTRNKNLSIEQLSEIIEESEE